jgi:hypothetical protein
MMVVLQLGGITLQGFEVPGRVLFGGAQSLAVHKLPGGARIIDAMGRDDADLEWSGVFSGGDASDRARLLDAMRAAGDVLPLTWDEFAYSVLIADLRLEYRSPWWIEYRIRCKVLLDEAQSDAAIVISAVSAIASDLADAGAYVDVGAAVAATSAAGALTLGTAASAAASTSLSAVQGTISQGIASAEVGLGSSDLATAVSASGTLAQLACAQGFVDRAAANVAEASN